MRVELSQIGVLSVGSGPGVKVWSGSRKRSGGGQREQSTWGSGDIGYASRPEVKRERSKGSAFFIGGQYVCTDFPEWTEICAVI